MIFKIFGYIFLVGFPVFLIDGEPIASIFSLVTALTLLIKNPDTNQAIANKLNMSYIPVKSTRVHVAAAWFFASIAGFSLPPEDSEEIPSTHIEAKAAAPVSEISPCIKERLIVVKQMWDELNSYRYKSNFHRFGFTLKGPYGDWEQLRKAEELRYETCQKTLPQSEKYRYLGLAGSYSYIHYVGKDWYQSKGVGNTDTLNFIEMVEYSLNNEGDHK